MRRHFVTVETPPVLMITTFCAFQNDGPIECFLCLQLLCVVATGTFVPQTSYSNVAEDEMKTLSRPALR